MERRNALERKYGTLVSRAVESEVRPGIERIRQPPEPRVEAGQKRR